MAPITSRGILTTRIKSARDTAGYTDLELAEESHIARSSLQRKLAGVGKFDIEELASIAEVVDGDLTEWIAEYAAARLAEKAAS